MLTIQQTPAVSRERGDELQVLDIPLYSAPKDFEFWTQLNTTHITLWAPSPPPKCIKIKRTCSQKYTLAYLNGCWCMQCLGTLHMLLAFPGFEGPVHSESGPSPWATCCYHWGGLELPNFNMCNFMSGSQNPPRNTHWCLESGFKDHLYSSTLLV